MKMSVRWEKITAIRKLFVTTKKDLTHVNAKMGTQEMVLSAKVIIKNVIKTRISG